MNARQAIRAGLVGCGLQGSALAEAARRTDSIRVVACADPDRAAADRLAAMLPEASVHDSVDALLAESDIDALLIATPHHVLCSASVAALRAGKHVLVEKPIGLNSAEAAEIERAAAEAQACCMAGYSMRFSAARHVRDLIDAGVVGEIKNITASITCPPMDRDWGWVAFPETGGGPLLFLGSHLVDMVLWFSGATPTEVFAHVNRRADTGADERSAFQVRFAGGVLAQCLVTQAASTVSYSVDVHGRDGRITLRGWNFLQFEIEVASATRKDYGNPTIIRPRIGRDNIAMMFAPELEEFAGAINERRAPSITVADGRRVLQVLDAVVASSCDGRVVPVELQQQYAVA